MEHKILYSGTPAIDKICIQSEFPFMRSTVFVWIHIRNIGNPEPIFGVICIWRIKKLK